ALPICQGRADVRRAQLIAMATVRDHYDAVLAEHYTRMLGEFEAKVTEQRALLERLGVSARPSGALAVDLGCGSGFQSVALARLGFRVLAVDFSQRLLAELNDRTRGLPVEAIAGDIRDVARLVPAGIELAVCMGDTLAHLDREADLDRVFHGVAGRLMAGARHEAPAGMVALVGVLGGPRPARQRRHGRMSSGRGSASGGAKTARYPSAGASSKKSTGR